MDWRKRAACRGVPTAVFFPEGQHPDKRRARLICAVCPVREQCLDYVLHTFRSGDDHGVWAGTSRNERAKMRKLELRKAS